MKRFLITCHAVFVLVGIATTMLGPILPSLVQRWHVPDSQVGGFFVAQFFGGFVGAIASTELARRFSLHFAIRAGVLVTAGGVFLVASPMLWLAIAGVAVYGLGIGFCSPSITAAAAEAIPGRRAAILNLLNFVWTLGAIVAPPLVATALSHDKVGISGALAAFGLILIPAAFLIPRPQSTATASDERAEPPAKFLGLVVASGVLLFIYVGIENGVAGWLPTFVNRMHAYNLRQQAGIQAAFWTALLFGRLAAAGISSMVSERRLLAASIATAAVGTIGILCVRGPVSLFLSVVVVGAGLAPIFPTALAILSHQLAGQSGSTLGFMFAAAGLGGAVLPYCIGALSSAAHDLRTGLALLIVAEVLLIGARFVMSRFEGVAPKEARAHVAAN